MGCLLPDLTSDLAEILTDVFLGMRASDELGFVRLLAKSCASSGRETAQKMAAGILQNEPVLPGVLQRQRLEHLTDALSNLRTKTFFDKWRHLKCWYGKIVGARLRRQKEKAEQEAEDSIRNKKKKKKVATEAAAAAAAMTTKKKTVKEGGTTAKKSAAKPPAKKKKK